jgi:hypothetical protein
MDARIRNIRSVNLKSWQMRNSLVGETRQRLKRARIRLLDSNDHGCVPDRQTAAKFAAAEAIGHCTVKDRRVCPLEGQ